MTWLRREDLEDAELHRLSPGATASRNHGGRRLPEAEDPLRTAFQRDRDRILHSTAFRRLQHKTQVFAAFEGDHYRTRMTHSLEVSQMSRSVCTALRLNADLAEAVALAHDLGHPPFGHVGEEALAELMAEHGGFRHNAQGARIVDYLEDRYGHGFGLNLTQATRRSLLKGNVPTGFPLSPDLLPKQPPPLEAHVVDLCDRIAYLCHDVDDALRAGIVAHDDVRTLALWQAAADSAGSERISRVVSEMVSLLVHDLVETTDRELADRTPTPRVRHGEAMTVAAAECLQFLRERFYRSARVLDVMRTGSDRIRSRFAEWLARPDRLPPSIRARIDADGLRRVVCDYVAGMTDRFLLKTDGT
jgi:dGTPase